MRILHTADWHLGKRLERVSRLEEQTQVMDEICRLADAHNIDLVLVAGDLFDTFSPSTAAVDLFYKTLRRLSRDGTRPVVAIAGNHDSADYIEAPNPLARECGILLAGSPEAELPMTKLPGKFSVQRSAPGFVELELEGHATPVRIILTPYANEQRLGTFLGEEGKDHALRDILASHWEQLAETYCDEKGINLLLTHLFFQPDRAVSEQEEALEEPEEEKPVLHVGGAPQMYPKMIPPQVQYTALGHLHRYIEVRKTPSPVIYSSSPLSYSFSEAQQQKFVVMIEAEAGTPVKHHKIPLEQGRPLLRLKAEGVEDAVTQLSAHQNALIELTLQSDTYLNAGDRRRLRDAHSDIITLIPDIQLSGEGAENEPARQNINLKAPMEKLFADYFESRKGQPPNEAHMQLLMEIRARRHGPDTTSQDSSTDDKHSA